MIPIRLQLKNFLSYGSELQTIDFNSYNLICFSGKNGHGKSALLDAITWAIWGYARKTVGAAKADQGLLRLGQTNMMVCLDFSCNNAHYRIRRELTMRHNKPYASLDYGIVQHDGSIASLTDKTIRATQQKIEHDIRLDFESFCNSAFLRQGQSNEFCKKSPKDRKDILTRILGLQHYETLKTLALEKAKEAIAEKQKLQLLQETITKDINHEEVLKEQKKSLTTAIKENKNSTESQQKKLHETKQELAQLQSNKQQYSVDLFALDQTKKQISLLQNQLRSVRAQWRATHKQSIAAQSVKQLQQEYTQLSKECTHYQELLQKGLQLKTAFLSKKEELNTFEVSWRKAFHTEFQKRKNEYNTLLLSIQKLESAHAHTLKTQEQYTKQHQTLEDEHKKIRAIISEREKMRPAFEKQKQMFDKRKEAYQRYTAAGGLHTDQLKELQQKQVLACKTDSASCPLCEQTVTASRRRFLNTKLVQQTHTVERKIQRLTRVVQSLKVILVEQHKQLEPLQKELHEVATYQRQLSEVTLKQSLIDKEIQSTVSSLGSSQEQLTALQKKQTTLQNEIKNHEQSESSRLQSDSNYKALRSTIQTYEDQAKSLGYKANEHKYKETRLKELYIIIEQQKAVEDQKPLQDERKRHITDFCNQLRALKKQKQTLEQKTTAIKKIDDTIAIQQKALEAVELLIQNTQKEKERLLQENGRLDEQAAKILHAKEHVKKLQHEMTEKHAVQQEYAAIAHAMGKDGIQALLIEEAIPEIECETNELLSRLTNNQTQIMIESLKDLKSGGTRETLDIFISDSLGIRPYELFSGGEAFRIDFALRIAISKLVARRAGTALQTLIVDEGFGSQDEEGLNLMMDALYKIQDDFEKIIIVSHLPFMKDHFPVHFTIEKGPTGSTVSVVQNG